MWNKSIKQIFKEHGKACVSRARYFHSPFSASCIVLSGILYWPASCCKTIYIFTAAMIASENIYRLINIDAQSVTPKYQQLTNSILHAIERGSIGKDYPLPSINDLSYELEISRDTAEKAYRHLKQLGIVGSVPGKGYFIAKTDFRQPIKVFFVVQ